MLYARAAILLLSTKKLLTAKYHRVITRDTQSTCESPWICILEQLRANLQAFYGWITEKKLARKMYSQRVEVARSFLEVWARHPQLRANCNELNFSKVQRICSFSCRMSACLSRPTFPYSRICGFPQTLSFRFSRIIKRITFNNLRYTSCYLV